MINDITHAFIATPQMWRTILAACGQLSVTGTEIRQL
jgi:hypothetical protein